MGFFNSIPHTRTSDQDFGWLIQYYKKLEGEYNDLVQTVQRLEDLYNTIPQQIQNAINQQIVRINQILNEFQKELDQMHGDVSDMQNSLNQLRQDLANFYAIINSQTDNKIGALKLWVEQEIANWSKKLPPMICPIHGYLEPLQEILYHIVDYLGCGITALEYDNLSISAQEYDNMEIIAIDYDLWAKCKVFDVDKCCYMYSPFTGQYVPIEQVVNQLADLHKQGITAQVYDSRLVTAEEYDDLEIGAYEYDWMNPLRNSA